jgi:hypothetical protein
VSTAIEIPRDRFVDEAERDPAIVDLFERASDMSVAADEAHQHVDRMRALLPHALDLASLQAMKQEIAAADDEAALAANLALAAAARAEEARDELAAELRAQNAIEHAAAVLAYQRACVEMLYLDACARFQEHRLRGLRHAAWALSANAAWALSANSKDPAPLGVWLDDQMRDYRTRMLELQGLPPRTREEIAQHMASALHIDPADLLHDTKD